LLLLRAGDARKEQSRQDENRAGHGRLAYIKKPRRRGGTGAAPGRSRWEAIGGLALWRRRVARRRRGRTPRGIRGRRRDRRSALRLGHGDDQALVVAPDARQVEPASRGAGED